MIIFFYLLGFLSDTLTAYISNPLCRIICDSFDFAKCASSNHVVISPLKIFHMLMVHDWALSKSIV